MVEQRMEGTEGMVLSVGAGRELVFSPAVFYRVIDCCTLGLVRSRETGNCALGWRVFVLQHDAVTLCNRAQLA